VAASRPLSRHGAVAAFHFGRVRPIKEGERALCAANGVNNPAEIRVGYDGIVIANSKAGPDFDITKAELYRALAMELPDGEGGFVPNPYKSWNEVSPSLPDEPILVFGPPPTSGTRDAFVELGMEHGALEDPQMAVLREQDETAFLQRATRSAPMAPGSISGKMTPPLCRR
jgi:phosphate transport system substrate-binding protein